MGVIVTNNAWGELSVPITEESTELLLQGGQGDRFPSAVRGKSWFYITIVDSSGNLEIARCTSRETDTLYVERGEDNTSPHRFQEGSKVELRVCAAIINDKVDHDELDSKLSAIKEDVRVFNEGVRRDMEDSIGGIKTDYATTDYVNKEAEALGVKLAKEYVTYEAGDKRYLLLSGGVLTGALEIKSSTPGQSLKVSGDAEFTGDVRGKTIHATSDVRLKENVERCVEEDFATRVMMVDPITYRWNKYGNTYVGVSAQQVKEILPEVIGEDKDGYLSVDYNGLVAALICAVKELKFEVDTLKKKSEETV